MRTFKSVKVGTELCGINNVLRQFALSRLNVRIVSETMRKVVEAAERGEGSGIFGVYWPGVRSFLAPGMPLTTPVTLWPRRKEAEPATWESRESLL